jgi:uracil-DNA glycosylase
MLNATLTVRKGQSNSHEGVWKDFTNAVIKKVTFQSYNILKDKISDSRPFVVFLCWGSFAKEKAGIVNKSKHAVLTSAHPSPFSCDRFFGNKHFQKTNKLLKDKGLEPIDWTLSD